MPTWVLSSSNLSVMYSVFVCPYDDVKTYHGWLTTWAAKSCCRDTDTTTKWIAFYCKYEKHVSMDGGVFREQYFTHKVLLNLGGFSGLVDWVFLEKRVHKGCVRLWPVLKCSQVLEGPEFLWVQAKFGWLQFPLEFCPDTSLHRSPTQEKALSSTLGFFWYFPLSS